MRHLGRWLLLALAVALPLHALWQAYPGKPVRMVNPNPPGAPIDILARLIGDQLSLRWKEAVIADNRPGGNGIIATDAVAKSAPDGYTLLFTATFTEAIVPFVYRKLPYDFEKDLVPVVEVARVPFVLLVPATSRIKSFQDVVDTARRKSPFNVGALQQASLPHLTWEFIRSAAGFPATYVPYKGSQQLHGDVLNGDLDLALDTISAADPFLRGGRLKAIAITAATRSELLPNVPTLDEAGLPRFESVGWLCIMAPAGTPAARITAIQGTVAAILKDEKLRERLRLLSYVPTGVDAAGLAATISADRARYG